MIELATKAKTVAFEKTSAAMHLTRSFSNSASLNSLIPTRIPATITANTNPKVMAPTTHFRFPLKCRSGGGGGDVVAVSCACAHFEINLFRYNGNARYRWHFVTEACFAHKCLFNCVEPASHVCSSALAHRASKRPHKCYSSQWTHQSWNCVLAIVQRAIITW